MNFTYETNRLVLKVEHKNAAPKVLEFYKKNRPYFDPWELTRSDNFYSEAYHSAALHLEYDQIVRKKFLRFWVYEKGAYMDLGDAAPIIGSVSLSDIKPSSFKSAMFGYKLDHDYWGMGYATEALIKLMDIAFNELKLHRLEAFIMPGNERSIKLIEKLGFSLEGLDRQYAEVNHKFEDHKRFALLSTDEYLRD